MRDALISIRDRLDRTGMLLSGLCVLHCVVGIVLVSLLGLGGGALLAPEIHEIGLALAIVIGVVTLGIGVARHGQIGPLVVGIAGIALMTGGLLVGHGVPEAVLTVAGVALVATAHWRNIRHTAC